MKPTLIIWCPTSDKPITTTYSSFRQARKVCSKLREANPGSVFHVMLLTDDTVVDYMAAQEKEDKK